MTLTSQDLARELGLAPSETPTAPTTERSASSGHRVITVAGVAGGVGTSTVAALLGALDVGVWHHHPVPVDVVVCGPASASTARAERVVAEHLAPQGCRPVLVVVSDGVRGTPSDSRARLTTLTPYCSDVLRLPWIPTWRDLVAPSLVRLPPPLVAPTSRLRELLELPALPTPTPGRTRRFRKDTP